MSLSPEPVDIDTPPDSPSHWASDSSMSTHELETPGASPVKRIRQPFGRQTNKCFLTLKSISIEPNWVSNGEGEQDISLGNPDEDVPGKDVTRR